MTIQLHIIQNDHFLQNLIYIVNKVKSVYKSIFFYVGYLGISLLIILATPILYTIVLLILFAFKRSVKNDLEKSLFNITDDNCEDLKIQYDKVTELVNLFNDLNLDSKKIPLLLKPIVNQIIAINNTFISLQQKLSVIEVYLEEKNIFMEVIPTIEEPLTTDYKKAMSKQSNKSIQKFLEEEEPFIF